MTWQLIARQDGRRTVDATAVRVLLGLLAFGICIAAYVYPIAGEEPITTARFTGWTVGTLTTLVPVVGILVGYNAVVSQRESGSLLLSLSLPHSRRDLLLGKLVGRAGPVAAVTAGSLLVAGALVVYPFGELEVVRSLGFVVLTVAFVVLWTGLGVAISLSVATKQRALVLAFGLLVLFVFLWDVAQEGLAVGLDRAGVVDGDLPGVGQFLFSLSPNRAFRTITEGFVDPSASVGGPWYVGEWAALVVFLAWLVVPLGLAARRFAGSDLA